MILDREVGEREFLEQLHELQHKLQFLKAQEFKEAKAVADVQDVIENLKYKVGFSINLSFYKNKLCLFFRDSFYVFEAHFVTAVLIRLDFFFALVFCLFKCY